MRHQRKTVSALVGTCACLALCVAPLGARAGTMTGGATEWTQLTNMTQLLTHTIQFIQQVRALRQQVEWMAKAGRGLVAPLEFLNTMQSTAGMVTEMRGIVFAGQSMSERWEDVHPGRTDLYQRYGSPAKAYAAIDESTRKSVQRAMQVLDLQVASKGGWPKDRQILAALSAKAQSADGQLKCTQVTNMLLLEMIRQLHLLRGVQIAHAEMMGYDVSGQVQRRQYEELVVEQKMNRGRTPGQSSAPGPEPTVNIHQSRW